VVSSMHQKPDAFHMFCQRQILQIRWFDFVSSAKFITQCQLPPIAEAFRFRRTSLLGHVARVLALRWVCIFSGQSTTTDSSAVISAATILSSIFGVEYTSQYLEKYSL